MKKLALALSLVGIVFGSAARADTMDEVVGNAVIVNFADGVEIRYYFHDDNTFTAEWHEGSLTGTWVLQGEDICIDVTEDGSGAECEDYPKDKRVGDSWTQIDDDDGSVISISIVEGGMQEAEPEDDGEQDADTEDEGAVDDEEEADVEDDSAADDEQDTDVEDETAVDDGEDADVEDDGEVDDEEEADTGDDGGEEESEDEDE